MDIHADQQQEAKVQVCIPQHIHLTFLFVCISRWSVLSITMVPQQTSRPDAHIFVLFMSFDLMVEHCQPHLQHGGADPCIPQQLFHLHDAEVGHPNGFHQTLRAQHSTFKRG